MIRLRPLRPREQRNLRHWAMELVVVVVGVLLALWAQEWVEGRREAQRQEKAMDSFHREIRITQAMASRPVMANACIVAQYRKFKELLGRDDPNWPGLVVDGLTGDGQRIDAPIIYPTNAYSVESYLRARETGAIEDYPDDQELAYEEIFYILRALDQSESQMDAVMVALRPLSKPRPIDAATRLQMLQQLAQFDRIRNLRLGLFQSLVFNSTKVGLGLSRKDEAEFAGWVGKDILVRNFGDCVQDIDWSTGKAEDR